MSTTIKANQALEEVERQFKTWRRTRKHYKPIPAELWEAAIHLTAHHSIPTIADRLLLNPAELKRRAHAISTQPSEHQQPAPAFIELDLGDHGANYDCIIEMEDKNGSKMTVHIKDSNRFDFHELCRAFWRKRK